MVRLIALRLFMDTVRRCPWATAGLLDKAFESYWNSNSPKETEVAIGKILQVNPSFEEVYERLKTGRAYSPDVTRGFFDWYSVAPPNIELHCLVFVPKDYHPDKKYPARVFLHGAVSNMDPTYVTTIINQKDPSYDTLQQIVIYPSGYYFATWWTDRQYDHVMQTLRRLKKLYNIDENRIRIGGISDGGTGTYAFANFNPTPWSCYTPYIGSAAVLDQVSRKQVYLGNFSAKPFFIVNTGHDNIFEPGTVIPYVNEILKVNTRSTFIFVDSSGHDLNWLPSLRDTISRFTSTHPRKTFPDTLYWQTENIDRYNRNHWVIINRVAKTRGNGIVDDPNNILVNGASRRAFHRDTISGIISVIRSGNEIRVSSKT
jgi:hypothetical protein